MMDVWISLRMSLDARGGAQYQGGTEDRLRFGFELPEDPRCVAVVWNARYTYSDGQQV
jgi:hypothetical protein